MAMTVRRLAAHPDLGLTLMAGRDNGDRTISWAHAIELADPTPYLSGAELVMTTGMNVGATDAEQFDYIARLSHNGVAALAFDTGTTFSAVPHGIIAAADAVGLPVLAVPPQTPFIAITRAVIDEITADQLRAVQRIADQQEVMVRETLRHGIPAVVTTLSKALAASVVVMETDGNVLAAAGPDAERTARLCAERRHRSHRSAASRVIADGDAYCVIQTLRATQYLNGHLAVRTARPLAPPDRLLVSHAVALISLDLNKPAKVVDAEHRLRSAVTRLAITQPHAVEPGLLRYFDLDPDGELIVLALTGTGPALDAEGHARHLLGENGVPFLLTAEQDEVLVVLPSCEMRVAAAIQQAIAAQLQSQVVGGISASGSLDGLPTLVGQARTAARAQPDSSRVNAYTDLSIFAVVLANRTADELALIAGKLDVLADAHRTSHERGAGLLETLEAYLTHNGSTEHTATALGIHRHTLRNRIAKISSLLDHDLTSAGIRAELWLALKARELLGHGATVTDAGPGRRGRPGTVDS
jgi:PucR family transcriptional regulator, purine catabolism regulatory protein